MGNDSRKLLVITGPTGAGKTEISAIIARKLGAEIISADSRQFYRGMEIGTAAPSALQLSEIPHHLVGHKNIADYYNVYMFEQEALGICQGLFAKGIQPIVCGGSGMYIDVLHSSIESIPDIDQAVRAQVASFAAEQGIETLRMELRKLDPGYTRAADLSNLKRLCRALEVCWQTGKPYSSFKGCAQPERGFSFVHICLFLDREILYQRINRRTELMIELGLEAEARKLLPWRSLNALNTVGYKEMFAYFDGETSLQQATDLIKRNTRHYAKKQMSWFRRSGKYIYIDAAEPEKAAAQCLELLAAR
jgi:tRNA dimethylallyltransferase